MPEQIDIIKLIDEIRHQVEPIAQSKAPWWERTESIAAIIVPKIENLASGWAGADKKVVAMQVVNDVWFKYFNIKFIPDIFEKQLVDYVASKAIDALVSKYHKLGLFKHSS